MVAGLGKYTYAENSNRVMRKAGTLLTVWRKPMPRCSKTTKRMMNGKELSIGFATEN
jgi:hypothetical protein